MTEATVLMDISSQGIARVWINRPERRNAFDEAVIAGLTASFRTLAGNAAARVVVLGGKGGHFSAGADLAWMRRQGELSLAENQADALALADMLRALHGLPQLTVARVQGAAIGGGAGLVAACDVAIGTTDAQFRFSETRLGLTPATISPYVVAAIGARWAKALFTTAEGFDAATAHRIGLLHDVLESADAVDARIEALAKAACANAPGALADAKRLVDDVIGRPIDADLAVDTAARIAARRESAEGREGLAAFLEKRRPSWDQPA